jgi:AraC family transcriptional regulator
MDDQAISCQRENMSGGGLHCMANDAETLEQLRTNKLLDVVPELIETLASALSKDLEATRQCVRRASALLSCVQETRRSLGAVSNRASERVVYRGGLAPWQARTLTQYIEANLGSSLSCEALAKLARLSVSYFARAFKSTFGCPPHEFLVRQRLERAKELMLQTDAPLAQIALDCGFADQAHLSRVFLRLTGERPASWRRTRSQGEVSGRLPQPVKLTPLVQSMSYGPRTVF